MKKAIYLPRFAAQRHTESDCDCKNRLIAMDFRKARLFWCVRLDSEVTKGQVICEAEVEKAVIEIPSPFAGKLTEICVSDSCECDTSSVLAYIETE